MTPPAKGADAGDRIDPPVIYHYTDPAGLIGILSSGQLWATDVRYLNDSSELQHAERLYRQVLEKLFVEGSGESLQTRLAKIALKKHSYNGVRKNYVVCFCAEDDLLTQWQSYGARGSGFSIGFDRKALESILPAFGSPAASAEDYFAPDRKASLNRIEYSEQAQKDYLMVAFKESLAQLSDKPSSSAVADRAAQMNDDVARSASRFRHPAFESENEWRIVLSLPLFAPEEPMFFRASNRTVIPYLKTPPLPNLRLPVVSITIGPTLHQELSVSSVGELLAKTGYYNFEDGRLVKIRTSNVPLARVD